MSTLTYEPLTEEKKQELLEILHKRFEDNMDRHPGLDWEPIQVRLESNPKYLWSLSQMEETGGEPDVIRFDEENNHYIFCDCSKETPKGRRSVCYDEPAREARKKHKPDHSAQGLAEAMGIELLSEDDYRYLQTLGEFDLKTSSWIKTPEAIRQLGGAVFMDRRYDHVFLYHNGADSYYSSRSFRGLLRV